MCSPWSYFFDLLSYLRACASRLCVLTVFSGFLFVFLFLSLSPLPSSTHQVDEFNEEKEEEEEERLTTQTIEGEEGEERDRRTTPRNVTQQGKGGEKEKAVTQEECRPLDT